jgi:hypothetical protein
MPKPVYLKLPSVERLWHPWHLWECYPAGFFEPPPIDYSGEEIYREFLSDSEAFAQGLRLVITGWKYSCEQNLTNPSMNRIAWLGQASACIVRHVPSCCRSGFSLLTPLEQTRANSLARKYLHKWLTAQKRKSRDT